MATVGRGERITLAVALIATIIAGILSAMGAGSILTFVVSGIALATLAAVVGMAVDQLSKLMSPGATGVLQSALGNLPELFVGIFALRAGLVDVVQAALVGSILANSLLVLGLAFVVGGARHGVQKFTPHEPRMVATLILLAVAALMVPTLASELHTAAGQHAEELSVACAVILLVVFVASIPFSLGGQAKNLVEGEGTRDDEEPAWPLWLTVGALVMAGVGAAAVSDWFVAALTPTIELLHISQTFTGLVIVAIAGNAVENVVGIQLAAKNKPDLAMSVILNSSLQVALALTPVLVLLSFVIGGAHLTLVLPLLLVVALGLSAILGTVIVFDGESTWLEGVALIGLYCILAASFWWG